MLYKFKINSAYIKELGKWDRTQKGDEIGVVTNNFGRKHSGEYTHNKELRFEGYTVN